MEELKRKFTPHFDKILNDKISNVKNPIIVLVGVSPYIDLQNYSQYIDDPSTFDKEGGNSIFDNNWITKILPIIMSEKKMHIYSHQQFSYLLNTISVDLFCPNTIVLYDNLRNFFPISKDMFVDSESEKENADFLDGIPFYHAEHKKINGNHYYSFKSLDSKLTHIPFFTNQKELDSISESEVNFNVIDLSSDQFACDFFLNECLLEKNFTKNIAIKTYRKNSLTSGLQTNLKQLNYILSLFGGCIYSFKEDGVCKNYLPKDDSLYLLRKFWGSDSKFRNINIYENPDIGTNTIPVSQGLIVDTIIKEYENCRKGLDPRDIFVTAPTGAGKSLLFQIPAFHASDKGDVTIVVSPLIALMIDQVIALHNDRNFYKAEFINSNLSLIEREKIIEQCKDGDTDILYLSPELLLSYDIRYFIGERNLGLLIIDEAHLISTWGRDFRVDYWFLGAHIHKIRKYSERKFPMVALTATAVYGGINDMVFDTISSLFMNDPHKFIGEVRRNDIEFVIDTHETYSGSYDKSKYAETVGIVKSINESNIKTLVYAPYKKHVNDLKSELDSIDPNMVVAYHGGMPQDLKDKSSNAFRTNKCKTMICTKAYGMGIDIPDIQVVYHHTPSGLLPDYIQEIGRVARKSSIKGYAALTFSTDDLRYSNRLFGLSSIKNFQIKEVLRKIHKHFEFNNRKRRMLMSVNDFAYIFDDAEDTDQKVSSALMMIEKDYLAKYRFNVLIARPKKLFSTAYARTTQECLKKLISKYGNCFVDLKVKQKGDYKIILLNLDKLWEQFFSDKSFPQLKNEFYRQKFLEEDKLDLVPVIKLTFYLEDHYNYALKKLENVFDGLKSTFSYFGSRGKFFKETEFRQILEEKIPEIKESEKFSKFILSSYAGKQIDASKIEGDVFLQRRRDGYSDSYRVFNSRYDAKLSMLIRMFVAMFENNEYPKAVRYKSHSGDKIKEYIRLGSFIEMLRLGSFETQGGEDPKIFLYINDPKKIHYDSENKDYKNSLVESIQRRHKISRDIFEHFFTNYFTNKSRWDFIEDYFLGMSKDDLCENYPGGTRNHIDIVEYIKSKGNSIQTNIEYTDCTNKNSQTPKEGAFYKNTDFLEIDGQIRKVGQWLTENPVLLHRSMVNLNFKIDFEYFKVLMSRLESKHYLYYRDYMRLDLPIDFPGYKEKICAKIPYNEDPVKFYKWWKTNNETVTLSKQELLQLFIRVNEIKPNTLLLKHLKMIN